MSVKRINTVKVTCDNEGCNISFTVKETTPEEELQALKNEGWVGTYRRCFCPECAKILKDNLPKDKRKKENRIEVS